MSGPFEGIPAGDLITRGLADVLAGRDSAEGHLLAEAWPRLKRVGLLEEADARRYRALTGAVDFHVAAYERLCVRVGPDAHRRLLAWSAELESGLAALDRAARRGGGIQEQRGATPTGTAKR